MRQETRPIAPTDMAPVRLVPFDALLGALGLGGLALGFAWVDPEGNRWPASALIGALLVDGLGRLAGRIAARRSPGHGAMAMASLILLPDRAVPAVAVALAAGAIAWGEGFPVMASLVAGLLAMGGIARLAIVRRILAGETADDPEP
ncbi:hypothetical protein ASG40_13700 [Methylobacterium sp. Leaf399]|uniref:hypothetical protein n=1 Tax=Methylobacterium sp. Leaf399 TaxID=1736364 RepID=UPI0006F22EAE|nr:hypothetical protein [Methylobacterium sp. Leaf399]KQT07390.1 hypothetical protein ASG40_13700 [Methylobacterium sp. Leaf399]